MNFIASLKKITEEIISSDKQQKKQIEACQALADLFFKVSGMEHAQTIDTNGIKTANGVALGTIDAAACIIDAARTHIFLRSVKEAIEDVLSDYPGRPVNILYAGTGPYATLLAPLTTIFIPTQLQMLLLEINPQTIAYLQTTVAQLNMDAFVTGIVEADASEYRLPEGYHPDIIVAETMLHALRTEPQVMIFANLINQCTKKTLLIPQMIQVSAALIKNIDCDTEEVKMLKILLKYNAKAALLVKQNKNELPIFTGGEEVVIPEQKDGYSHLALLTNIQVYKNNRLLYKQSSGLTMPCLVMDLNSIKKWPAVFNVTYKLGEDPGFQFSFLENSNK